MLLLNLYTFVNKSIAFQNKLVNKYYKYKILSSNHLINISEMISKGLLEFNGDITFTFSIFCNHYNIQNVL